MSNSSFASGALLHPARGNRLFCFGLGYSALALARRLLGKHWRVAGTCRSAAKADSLRAVGIEPFLFDRNAPLADAAAALAGTTHLLSSVPPDASGDPVVDHHGNDLVRLEGVKWTGYLSTTGVYGDRGGDWVTERDALRPIGPRGRARVAAEEAWLGLGHVGHKVHVFRLAGIYGPGRSALDTLREGRAKRVAKPGQIFSRIHVDDIATILEASIAKPDAGAVYNVCDDEPAPPQDVIAYAAALLGVPAPPEVPYEEAAKTMSEMARSFYAESKRVSNRRIKDELGVTLAYPDYREGLKALLASGA
ncbi:MAG: SDR family oxidoreductase [Telmatospirillum sp.]|nr:SDR family oxidoreductase [Telmatospirillum sp.]